MLDENKPLAERLTEASEWCHRSIWDDKVNMELDLEPLLGFAAHKIRQYETALRSIAANTCCDKCQEAALVAQAALGEDAHGMGSATGTASGSH